MACGRHVQLLSIYLQYIIIYIYIYISINSDKASNFVALLFCAIIVFKTVP